MDKRLYIVGGLLLLGGAALFFSRYAKEQAEKDAPEKRIVLEDDRKKTSVPRALKPVPDNLVDGPKLDVEGAKAHIAAAKRLREQQSAGDAERLVALTKVYAQLESARAAQRAAKKTFAPDRDGIKGAMQHAKPALKECYEPWAEQNPELAGKITTRFVIKGEGGTPDKAEIKAGGLGSALLDGCVLSVVRDELHFEPTQDNKELVVNYPLTFTVNTEDE